MKSATVADLEAKMADPAPPPYVWPADRSQWTVGDCLMEKAMILMQTGKYDETYLPVFDEKMQLVRGKMQQILRFRAVVDDDWTDLMKFAKGNLDAVGGLYYANGEPVNPRRSATVADVEAR